MNIIKHSLAFALMLGLTVGCMHMGLAAWEEETAMRPRPPLEYLLDMCNQGEQSACEAYADLFFAQEEQTK